MQTFLLHHRHRIYLPYQNWTQNTEIKQRKIKARKAPEKLQLIELRMNYISIIVFDEYILHLTWNELNGGIFVSRHSKLSTLEHSNSGKKVSIRFDSAI